MLDDTNRSTAIRTGSQRGFGGLNRPLHRPDASGALAEDGLILRHTVSVRFRRTGSVCSIQHMSADPSRMAGAGGFGFGAVFRSEFRGAAALAGAPAHEVQDEQQSCHKNRQDRQWLHALSNRREGMNL